ncbi:MAG TPA: AAA family ATPase [Candidatus Acidoferrum sp.]|nr:AAA family ATPase [Candidatus Acidoferrum sp.]
MFIGREHERARVYEAILERRSLLLCGPADSGKSALLAEVLSHLAHHARQRCLVCSADGPPIAIWRQMVQELKRAEEAEVLGRVEREAGSQIHFERWLRKQTSLRLRGIIGRATRAREYSVFLDARSHISDGVYRLLQEWIWSGRTPVILLARGWSRKEIGKAAQLYWHEGLRLSLGALDRASAETLLQETIGRLQLADLADGQFREFVLERSAGLPGRLIRLCELAAGSAYHYHGHVKLSSLAVDFLLDQRDRERAIRHA